MRTGYYVLNNMTLVGTQQDIDAAIPGKAPGKNGKAYAQAEKDGYLDKNGEPVITAKQALSDCNSVESECKIVGWMLDGFPIYTPCAKLRSCYTKVAKPQSADSTVSSDDDAEGLVDDDDTLLTATAASNMLEYSWEHTLSIAKGECDLDWSNGYEFSGLGIKDNEGKVISGYGYVVSEGFFSGIVQWYRGLRIDTNVV
jgi:hypothetical protein